MPSFFDDGTLTPLLRIPFFVRSFIGVVLFKILSVPADGLLSLMPPYLEEPFPFPGCNV